jgi:hypothetical protein
MPRRVPLGEEEATGEAARQASVGGTQVSGICALTSGHCPYTVEEIGCLSAAGVEAAVGE